MSQKSTRDFGATLDEHAGVVTALRDQAELIERIADALVSALRAGKRVYVAGNGGSAADAQHIAGELLGRFKLDRRALPVIALTTDSSTITAVGNDLGFERVFARQLEELVQPGDVVWLLSTSGNSPNIIAAARTAAQADAVVIGFTGAGGGELASHCALLLRVAHDSSDRIQEAHELAYHYICQRVEAAFA